MKKIFLISTIALGLFSFINPVKPNFTLTGIAKGVQDGTMVYLERQDEAKQLRVSVLELLLRDRVVSQEKLALVFHYERGFELYQPRKDLLDPQVLTLFSKELRL